MTILSASKKFIFIALGPVAIGVLSAWIYLNGGRYISTDNAYVKADITSVSSEISGKVVETIPHENEHVSVGQILYRLAREPLLITLSQIEATLDNIRRDIEIQKIEYNTRSLEVESAKIDLEFQEKELGRARLLLEKGTIASEQYDQYFFAWRRSENALARKQLELAVAQAKLIDPELPTEEHPLYRKALAELEKAKLNLSYTEINSPSDGIAVNISALPGENIIMGTSLLNIIDDSPPRIVANFKETDLTYIKVGQSVEIRIDSYPDNRWHGSVTSITPATGSEFSLLPAQNSSGNWVKVVQRVTVNIEFNDLPAESKLSTGMSAEVSIDTGHQRTLPWFN